MYRKAMPTRLRIAVQDLCCTIMRLQKQGENEKVNMYNTIPE